MNYYQYLLQLGYIDLPFKRQSLGVENIINNSSIPVAIIFLVRILIYFYYYFCKEIDTSNHIIQLK